MKQGKVTSKIKIYKEKLIYKKKKYVQHRRTIQKERKNKAYLRKKEVKNKG